MSNAFRTPVIDQLRTLIRSLRPCSSIFPIRHVRSSLHSFLSVHQTKSRLKSAVVSKDQQLVNSSIQELLDFISVTDSRVAGSGVWFRFWSSRFRDSLKKYLSRLVVKEKLIFDSIPESSSFTCPIELLVLRHPDLAPFVKAIDSSVSDMRRTMGSLWLKFPKLFFEPRDVRGLQFQRRRLESHSPSNWGKYEIRCDASGKDFAAYIQNGTSREKIHRAYYSVFNDSKEFHGSILRVLRERQRFAKKLGFASWTQMQSVMNGLGDDETVGTRLVEKVYAAGLPGLRKSINTASSKNVASSFTTIDESYVAQSLKPYGPEEFKKQALFEVEKITKILTEKLGTHFDVSIVPEPSPALLSEGWHKSVIPYRVVSQSTGGLLGHIYLDLYRRKFSSPLAGAGPHCYPLKPSDNHVRIFMGLHPPYRSEITFKKERLFTYEEITALMHEFGHALHILCRPRGSPISQLPMDLRESVSVFCELYSLTDTFMDTLADNAKLSREDKVFLKRDEWFYVDMLRNIAVTEHIHSSAINAETASVDDLKRVAREVYGKLSPLALPDFVDPLGGQVSQYLIDGESRVGYLLSYLRSASAMVEVGTGKLKAQEAFRGMRGKVVDAVHDGSVTRLLESRMHGDVPSGSIPVDQRLKAIIDGGIDLWRVTSPVPVAQSKRIHKK